MAIKDIIQSQIQKTKEARQKQLASSTNAVQSGSTSIPKTTETPKVTQTQTAKPSVQQATERLQTNIATTKDTKQAWWYTQAPDLFEKVVWAKPSEIIDFFTWPTKEIAKDFEESNIWKAFDLVTKATYDWRWKDLFNLAKDVWHYSMVSTMNKWEKFYVSNIVEPNLTAAARLKLKQSWLSNNIIDIIIKPYKNVVRNNLNNYYDSLQYVYDKTMKWAEFSKQLQSEQATLQSAIENKDVKQIVWLFAQQWWQMLPMIAATVAWWMVWWVPAWLALWFGSNFWVQSQEALDSFNEDPSLDNVSYEAKRNMAMAVWALNSTIESFDTMLELFWVWKAVPVKSSIIKQMIKRKLLTMWSEAIEEMAQYEIEEIAAKILGSDRDWTSFKDLVEQVWFEAALYSILFPSWTAAWIQQKNINTAYNDIEQQVRQDIPDATQEQVEKITESIIKNSYKEEEIKKLEWKSESLYEERQSLQDKLESAKTDKEIASIEKSIAKIDEKINKIDKKVTSYEDSMETLNEEIWLSWDDVMRLRVDKTDKQWLQDARKKLESMLETWQFEWYIREDIKAKLEEVRQAFYVIREKEIEEEKFKDEWYKLTVKDTKWEWWLPSVEFYDWDKLVWEWNPFAWYWYSEDATQEQKQEIKKYMDRSLETNEQREERESIEQQEKEQEERYNKIFWDTEEDVEEDIDDIEDEIEVTPEELWIEVTDDYVQDVLEEVEWEEYKDMQENTKNQQEQLDYVTDYITDNAYEAQEIFEEQQEENEIFDSMVDENNPDNPMWVDQSKDLYWQVTEVVDKTLKAVDEKYKSKPKQSAAEKMANKAKSKKWHDIYDWFKDFFTPSMSRLYEINPRLAWAVHTYEARTWILTNIYKEKVKNFVKALENLRKEKPDVYKKLSLALFDYWMVEDIDIKQELKDAWIDPKLFDDVAEVLNKIALDYQSAGLNVTINDKYFPRKVKDYELLSEFIFNKSASKSLQHVLNILNNEEMDSDEKSKRIKNTLEQYYVVNDEVMENVNWILNDANLSDKEKINKLDSILTKVDNKETIKTLKSQIEDIKNDENLSEWEKEEKIHRLLINNFTWVSERSDNAKERKITLSEWKTTEEEREQWEVDDIIDFYEDPIETLDTYINDMVKKTELKKLLWWLTDDKEAISEKFDDSLAKILQDMDLTKDEVEEAKKTIQAIIKSKPSGELTKAIKNFTYAMFLWNTISWVQQFEDTAKTMMRWGSWFFNVVKSMLNRSKIKMDDTWLNDAFAMIEKRWMEKWLTKWLQKHFWLEKRFKLSWFNWFDSLWKTSFLSTAFDANVKLANNEKKSILLKNRLTQLYWQKKWEEIFNKYKDWKLRDWDNIDLDIMVDLLYDLWETQPIYKSWMPVNYLNSNFGRVFYCLYSFSLKQIDRVVQWTKKTYRNQLLLWRTKAQASAIATAHCIYTSFVQAIYSAIITDVINTIKWDSDDTVWKTLLEEWWTEALKQFGLNSLAWFLKLFSISKYDWAARKRWWIEWFLSNKLMPASVTALDDLIKIWVWKKEVAGIWKYWMLKPIYYIMKNYFDALPSYKFPRWDNKTTSEWRPSSKNNWRPTSSWNERPSSSNTSRPSS